MYLNQLANTYDLNGNSIINKYTKRKNKEGVEEEIVSGIAMVGHTVASTDAEITLTSEGKLESVTMLKRIIYMPVTEDSDTRTSSPVPHPLNEKLKYLIATDDNKHRFDMYMEQLGKWQGCHCFLEIIWNFLNKENNRTQLKEKIEEEYENLNPKSKSKTGIKDITVRWRVTGIEGETPETWKNENLMAAWANYYVEERKKDNEITCHISGKEDTLCRKHPIKLFGLGSNARLISSNTKGNLLDSRFSSEKEIVQIGYITSQKSHNVLRYLLTNQYTKFGETKYSIWLPGDKNNKRNAYETESPEQEDENRKMTVSVDYYNDPVYTMGRKQENAGEKGTGEDKDNTDNGGANDDGFDFLEAALSDDQSAYNEIIKDVAEKAGLPKTMKEYVKYLNSLVIGGNGELGQIAKDLQIDEETKNQNVCVIAIKEPTLGRLSVVYFTSQNAVSFFRHIRTWRERFCWYNMVDGHILTPASYDVIDFMFGAESEDGKITCRREVYEQQYQMLYNCIINGSRIPHYFIECLWQKTKKPYSYSKYNYNKLLTITCAMIRAEQMQNGKELDMKLDLEKRDRDYLFGRLWAIYDCLERKALRRKKCKEPRTTNAERCKASFIQNPAQTVKNLEERTVPYWNALSNFDRKRFRKEKEQIMEMFNENDFNNKNLEPDFIIGSVLETKELEKKIQKKNKEEPGVPGVPGEDIELEENGSSHIQ